MRKLGKMTLTLQRGRLRFGDVNLLTVVQQRNKQRASASKSRTAQEETFQQMS